MLFKHDRDYADLSAELSDELDWQPGFLKTLVHHLDVTAFAIEPVSGLLAVGTSGGVVSIHGSPGVECRLVITEPPASRVRILQFAASLFKLLCVDDHDRLHIWDLTTPGRPKMQRIVNLPQPINSLTVSPSHAHAFIALANGVVKTYDLLCLRMSPYATPNLWAAYEKDIQSKGMPAIATPGSMVTVDVVVHPRDLNLLFVAYGGGVILSDLNECSTVRAYELVLPPGAPGGIGYQDPEILLPRRPSVTAIAVHPSGHILAVGHADGSIAFWALEDEDKPLRVCTLDSEEDEDVSTLDVTKLEAALPHGQPKEPHLGGPLDVREPIFKITWSGFPNSSDPRGGDTVLTVFGGFSHETPPGLTTFLLPPLNPPAPPTPSSNAQADQNLHSETRGAMRASLLPRDCYTYTTSAPVQDFLLLPHANPHFAGAWDPRAVLLLTDSDVDGSGDTRVVEAHEFPPPVFLTSKASPPDEHAPADPADDPQTALTQELEDTLQSMTLTADPRPVRVPSAFWGVYGNTLVKVEKDAYAVLTRESSGGDRALPVRGGIAWIDDPEGHMKQTKYQPHRILITHHPDFVVRFQDFSSQQLLSSPENPLSSSFPTELPALTIELASLLADPSLHLTPSRTARRTSPVPSQHSSRPPSVSSLIPEDTARIGSVHIAPESLECVIVLRTGAVVLYKLDNPNESASFAPKDLSDAELVSLEHVNVRTGLRYHPFLGIKPAHGQVSACAVSDIGFLAVAYASGALLVIDLRGPRIIMRSGTSALSERSFLHRHSVEPIQSLTWTVCKIASDPIARIRLIAISASGDAAIHTLMRSEGGAFAVSGPPVSVDAVAKPLAGDSSVVLDARSGGRCRANRNGLATALATPDSDDAEEAGTKKCVWVSAGAKGARCSADVDGERIAKVDWGSKVGAVRRVAVIHKSNACALVAFTERDEALVYSLPYLELLHTLPLGLPNSHSPTAPLTTDDTGDILTITTHSSGLARSTHLTTLFSSRRTAPFAAPLVDLAHRRGTVPAQPSPVALGPASVLGSWLGYFGVGAVGGEQIDALLAGPDRPAPPQPRAPPTPYTPKDSEPRGSASSSVQAASASMSSGVSDLYNRLGTALAERGYKLGDLEESFKSLEEGSKGMLSQAKQLAAQQTMKRWYNF
ncbi:lethal giant larvae like, C-terminal-domain-containing protein [Amylocystis lapponica]|nr:lethal giant larvae like, C-terminal-domain-containing protein [Amylocystis lapponica]